jgi:hypothetical protein
MECLNLQQLELGPTNTECGICMEERSNVRAIVPGCRHGFCYQCLIDWRNSNSVGEDRTFCRREILQGVEDDILTKARYYGARAAKKGLSNQEKEDARGLAFSELDKETTKRQGSA